MIPTWLKAHLLATGALSPDGYGRAIRAAVCRGCGAHVLRGLDADRLALPCIADPEPVSSIGEVAALLAGAATYDLLTVSNRRAELQRRDQFRIGGRRGVVLADHRCGVTWPAAPTPTAVADRPKETTCPF